MKRRIFIEVPAVDVDALKDPTDFAAAHHAVALAKEAMQAWIRNYQEHHNIENRCDSRFAHQAHGECPGRSYDQT